MTEVKYICVNPKCEAHNDGMESPKQRNCYVCKEPLVEKHSVEINEEEQYIIDKYPYVIAYQFKQMLVEQEPRNKLNILKDTFYNYLKYIGLMTASEFLFSSLKSRDMVREFRNNLYQPSFGHWNMFTKKCLQFLKNNNHEFFIKELPGYFNAIDDKKEIETEVLIEPDDGPAYREVRKLSASHALVEFRNKYIGHGQTLSAEAAKQLWDKFYPVFLSLLNDMRFVVDYPMFKQSKGNSLSLMSSDIHEGKPENPYHAISVWIENNTGAYRETLPFYVLLNENNTEISIYESTNGESIRYFSPESSEVYMKGEFVRTLNKLLIEKENEKTLIPNDFNINWRLLIEVISNANKNTINELKNEKKVFNHLYLNRKELEAKLREWTESRFSIFFLAAEAGSGKTNALVEMLNQYQDKKYNVLLLRAARFQTSSLENEIRQLLNLSPEYPIERFPFFRGKQDQPFILLIDGLNENKNPTILWNDIKEFAKKFPDGKLKIVVSCRVNSELDYAPYPLATEDNSLFYAPGNVTGDTLTKLAHRLIPLNMVEMEQLWKLYVEKRPDQFKPQFSFDDIAYYDRNLYNIISNPLVLRLFLQTYHDKLLPEEKGAYLNVWADWFAGLEAEQQKLLSTLAAMAWESGENRFSQEAIRQNPDIKKPIEDNTPGSVFQELLKEGWLSRYFIEGNSVVSFTVEASLFYIVAKEFIKDNYNLSNNELQIIANGESQLRKAVAIEYLKSIPLIKEIDNICYLIDNNQNTHDLFIVPVFYHLRAYGATKIIDSLLKNLTVNDLKFITILIENIDEAHQFQILEDIYKRLANVKTELKQKKPYLLLRSLIIYPIQEQIKTLKQLSIDVKPNIEHADKDFKFYISLIERDIEVGLYNEATKLAKCLIDTYSNVLNTVRILKLYELLGEAQYSTGNFNVAAKFWSKALNIIESDSSIKNSIQESEIYNSLGCLYLNSGLFKKAYVKLIQAIDISSRIYGHSYSTVLVHKSNLADYFRRIEKFDMSKELLDQVLMNAKRILPSNHKTWHQIHYTYGWHYISIEKYEQSVKHFKQALEITLCNNGKFTIKAGCDHNNIGVAFLYLDEAVASLDHFERAKEIFDALNHTDSNIYGSIGSAYFAIEDWENAEKNFRQSLQINELNPNINSWLGELYLKKGLFDKALQQFEKAKLLLENHENGNKFLLAKVYSNISEVYEKHHNDNLQAILFYEKSLENLSEIYDSDHGSISYCLHEITRLHIKNKKFDQAEYYLEEWLNANQGISDSTKSNVLVEHATIQGAMGNLKNAIEYFNESWQLEQKGGIAWQIHYCYKELNEALKSLEWLEKCALTREARIGLEHETTQNTYKELINYAKECGNNELADKYVSKIITA